LGESNNAANGASFTFANVPVTGANINPNLPGNFVMPP
jgi:hypothetical protein